MLTVNVLNQIVRSRMEADPAVHGRGFSPREEDETFNEILNTVLKDGVAGGGNTGAQQAMPAERAVYAPRVAPNDGVKDRKLMDACVELESIFVARMFKEMRKNLGKTGWLDGGFAEEIFQDMLYDEYSKELSKNSNLGLAKMVYTQLGGK